MSPTVSVGKGVCVIVLRYTTSSCIEEGEENRWLKECVVGLRRCHRRGCFSFKLSLSFSREERGTSLPEEAKNLFFLSLSLSFFLSSVFAIVPFEIDILVVHLGPLGTGRSGDSEIYELKICFNQAKLKTQEHVHLYRCVSHTNLLLSYMVIKRSKSQRQVQIACKLLCWDATHNNNLCKFKFDIKKHDVNLL